MKSSLQNEVLIFWASKLWKRQGSTRKTESEGVIALSSEYSPIWLKGREKTECLGMRTSFTSLEPQSATQELKGGLPSPSPGKELQKVPVSVSFWHLPLGAPQPELLGGETRRLPAGEQLVSVLFWKTPLTTLHTQGPPQCAEKRSFYSKRSLIRRPFIDRQRPVMYFPLP